MRGSLLKPLSLAALFAVLRFWLAGQLGLAEDEAYYWEWSRSLALSYYDQGPMLALAIRAGTWLLGPSEQGVRLASVLSGFGVSALAVAALHGPLAAPRLALWTVAAINGLLLFAVGGVLMMHDTLMSFFWMLGLYAALRALSAPRWWLLAGLAVALGGMSKYTMVLLPACLLGGLLVRPSLRPQLRSPWLWLGALIALSGALPIVLWNSANGWPSFAHVGSLAGGDPSRRSGLAWLEYLSSQLGLVTPALLAVIWLAWRDLWSQRQRASEARWLLWAASVPVAVFFLLLSLRTRVEGNWAAPAYLGGLLLGALWLQDQGARRARLGRWALGVSFAFTTLVYAQALRPFLPIPQRFAKADAPARLDGWRELGERVEAERLRLGPGAIACAHTYQTAAELGFYLPGQQRVLIVQTGLPNHQYRFWNRPELSLGKDAVIVYGQDWELGEIFLRFERWEPLPDHVFTRNGIEVRRTHLARGYRFKG